MNSSLLKIKRLAAVMFCAVVGLIPALAGEKAVGVAGGISTRNGVAPVAGVYFQLGVIPHLRIAPSLNYQFRKHGADAFAVNVDVHSPWAIVGSDSRLRVYPLAGFHIARWNYFRNGDGEERGRIDRIGFNVGGGVEWMPSKDMRLKLYAEGKYRYAHRFDTGVVTVGIGYVF